MGSMSSLYCPFFRGKKKKQSQLSNAIFLIHFLVVQIIFSWCRRITGYYSNLQSTLRPCLNLKSRTHNIPHKGMDINGIPIQKFLVKYYVKPKIGQKKKHIFFYLKHDPILVFLYLFFFYSHKSFSRVCVYARQTQPFRGGIHSPTTDIARR